MTEKMKPGDTYINEGDDYWSSGIDVGGHGNAIICHARPEAEAVALRDRVLAALTRPTEEAVIEKAKRFAPCPVCKQYSHSIGETALTEAFNVFQSMFSHRNDGIPTQYCFDETARDAAQVIMARIEAQEAVIEKLVALITNDDHKRLCEGRQYTCTCGYDDKVQAAALEAARKQA